MHKSEFIYGYHTIKALLMTQPTQVYELYLQTQRHDKRLQELMALAKRANIRVAHVSRRELDTLLNKKVQHQGMVAACQSFVSFDESVLTTLLSELNKPKLVLILDGIQDPHNLGACLRSANAFGVDVVIAPKDRAVGITPVVRKVAAGAVATTPFVQVTNLARTMRWLQAQGIWLVGMAAHESTPLHTIDCNGDIGVVLGSEDKGMRRLTAQHCDYLANIPMQGTVASLNVSVATAICLYEIKRQRGFS